MRYKDSDMAPASLHTFDKDIEMITIAQALEEIQRTRRQVHRFEHLPHASSQTISPEDASALRRECDALEAKLNRLLSTD
jgi:hypothetical protein